MSRQRSRLVPLIPFVLFVGMVDGCASLSAKDEAGSLTPSLLDSGAPSVTIPDGSKNLVSQSDSGLRLNPLCGLAGRCLGDGRGTGSNRRHIPDDPYACSSYDAGGGVSGEPNRDAGPPLDASVDARASRDAAAKPTDAGARDAGAVRDTGADVAVPPTPSGSPEEEDAQGIPGMGPPGYTPTPSVDAGPLFACQVHAVDNGAPIHECAPAGIGDVGSPCAASLDCRAGLACIGSVGAGQCQPYCCDPSSCTARPRPDGGSTQTFCAERPLLEGNAEPILEVPVCVPADNCRLDEPYDCDGAACACARETTCAVVLPDGTTSCVRPGKGRVGDSCDSAEPCASGYFCSAVGQCIKICKPGVTDALCSPGKCQAAFGLPEGFGLCVSSAPAAR